MVIVGQVMFFIIELLVTLGIVFGFQLIADYYTMKYSNEVVWIGNMSWRLRLTAIIYFSLVGTGLSIVERLYFFNTLALVDLRIMAILLLIIFLGTQIATIVLAVTSVVYFLFWGFHSYILFYTVLYIALFIVSSLINQSKMRFHWQCFWFGFTATIFWLITFVYKNSLVADSLTVATMLRHILEIFLLGGIPVLMIRKLEQNQMMISNQALDAYIDGLTQIYNYHSFSLNFERAFQKNISSQLPLSLMIMDLDGFKQVNDTYGHLAGNYVLHEFSRMLAAISNANIVPYRIGGEEMALVFNDVPPEQAQQLAEQLLEQLRQHHFQYENSDIHLTFSAGISQARSSDETSRNFFRRVDNLTYVAKRAGGNQIAL